MGLLEPQYLIYPRLSTGFDMLMSLTNSNPKKFQFDYLPLYHLFSVTDGFGYFCIESLCSSIQSMLDFLKGPFLSLHFSYDTLITFPMMLPVTLLSKLMILDSALSLIRHLIYGNNQSWLLNLNLTNETPQTKTGSSLLISVLEKLNLFPLTGLITLVLYMRICP